MTQIESAKESIRKAKRSRSVASMASHIRDFTSRMLLAMYHDTDFDATLSMSVLAGYEELARQISNMDSVDDARRCLNEKMEGIES